ncbi:helix-turn-helix transcriptional regulator [Klebsiella oxytoca]|uniref:helix-turn-helix domain-containing protein n=1 Tax=Klebsiella oxytoca TaxID=571 RepID=UPI00254B9C7D|nr:helix-turn-helix transcriptional regulator [Klebsiella oxytoca]MEC5509919.1 helix-turn-helix transcriptional regulator [Klebsiella oxytoca]
MKRSFRVERALKKMGQDIQNARKRRRITTTLMAQRMGISRVTLSKIEAGDPKVAMGSYALALYILGKLDELENIIDRTNDPLGLDIVDSELPIRVRHHYK